MKRLLHACASLLFALLGLNCVHAQSDVIVTPQTANPAAVIAGVTFTLTTDFIVASTDVSKSTNSTGMPVWTLSATTVRWPVAIPPTPRKVNLTYQLGAITPGTTGRIIWKLNGRAYSESNFTVPPAGVPISAAAVITVDPVPTAALAKVQIAFREYAAITGQKEAFQEGNRIILEASAERVAVIQIFPQPPLPVASLTFNLGPQAAGEYTAVFKLNGRILAEKVFRIANPSPPIAATVTSTFHTSSAGTNAHVSILLPDPYYDMTVPGTPEITGNTIRINATLSRINTLVALPTPNVLEQDYPLGVLAPGIYTLVYQINSTTRLIQTFRVGEIVSNEPKLLSVEARFLPAPNGGALLEDAPQAGIWQGVAHLMLMPDLAAAAGPLVVEGNAFKSTILLQPLGRPISENDKPRPVEVFFNLGSPPAGAYTFAVTLPVTPAQTKQTAFRVVPVHPPPLLQLAYVEVRKSPDSHSHLADVGVVLTDPSQTITDWGTPVRTGNQFSVALTSGPLVVPDPVLPGGLDGTDGELANNPVLQGQAFVALAGDIAPGAVPFRIVRHRYDLGPLDAGLYQFTATTGGKTIGSREFKIRETPPPPGPLVAAIEIGKSAAGTWNATVRLVLPNGLTVTGWGTAVKDGNQFKASLSTGPAPVPDPSLPANPIRPMFSHTYDLGGLTEGAYSFAVYQGADQLGLRQFRVTATPPVPGIQPRLAFIDIKAGSASTAAEAGIILPQPGFSITSWGDVVREGDKLKAIVQVKVDEIIPAVALPPSLERHLYSLGNLEAGEYKLTLCYQTSPDSTPLVLGARAFQVRGSPPPTEPTPLVACLDDGINDQGSFMDLCLAWPQPGWTISDWGTPVREGNQFKTTLVVGKQTDPLPPTGTDPGLVSPDGTINDDMLGPFREIGGWPASLVRHRYLMGLLAPGEYQFNISIGTSVLASKLFTVKDPLLTKPLVTASAAPVRRSGTTPAPFTLTFTARSGWPTDPSLGTVTLKGPHDFSAAATRLSGGIISMDPLGILARGEYEITPPGGTWDPDDNGRYEIFIDSAAVKDRAGHSPANPVGSLLVQILPTPPPPPPALKADVAVTMADGQWSADVSFENTGGWWKVVWGGVKPRGPVLFAEASLEVLPPWVKMAIPASFSHTFPLGELKPGFYSFLFRSSAGHIGHATITVPGLEPPSSLDAWKLNIFGTTPGSGDLAGDLADNDHDGQCTLAEFALGGHPGQPDAPTYRAEIQQGHLALVYHRAMGSETSVACEVELSPNMKDWVPAGPLVSITTGTPAPDGTQSVSACQTAPLGASRYPYMRLRFRKLGDH